MNTDRVLPRSRPEHEGIASSGILQLVEALESQMHEVHSFMLLRHGKVVAEGWWSPYRPDYPHLMFSVSKSFTSTAVGFAVAEGRLSIHDSVLSFFPEESSPGDFLAKMTVEHLLTMTTGHVDDTWPAQIASTDWIRAFFGVPIVHPPGTHFLYNTGATHILAAIVQKVTGQKLIDYLQPRLFEPLDIQNVTWQESPQGIAVGGYGLSITTEALACFGQLYLQKGKWGDRQILSEAWVEAATSAQVPGGDPNGPSDWAQGYGYQFWRSRHGGYQASGVFGQGCIVLPHLDAVFVYTGGIDVLESQRLLDIVWKTLLPAFDLEQPVAAPAALANKLASLSLAPVTSSILPPPSLRTYAVDANALNIESLAFDFTPSGGVITFGTPGGQQSLNWGYGEWRPSRINLFNEYWLSGAPTPVVASGGWTAEDRFSMIIRLIETPFFYTLVCHFVDDELLLEMRINVTMDIPTTLLLTAHPSVGIVQVGARVHPLP